MTVNRAQKYVVLGAILGGLAEMALTCYEDWKQRLREEELWLGANQWTFD